MANPYPALITDANSETRVAGQISFTDPANQPGFAPVTCVLIANGIDTKTVALHPALWSGLQDNPWDANTLSAIPAGLGLTFLFDGTSANITTTTAGTWAFTLLSQATVAAGDAWRATLRDAMLALATMPESGDIQSEATLGSVYTLPSGAVLAPALDTHVQATAGAVEASFSLAISRLA